MTDLFAYEEDAKSFFEDVEVISRYTREDALNDGVLVDVSKMAKEAGWGVPVAITQALHSDISDIPKSKSYQSYEGRLWDVLFVGLFAAKGASTAQITYELTMHQGRRSLYRVKSVIGPGDIGEPVVTLMRPDED